MKFDAEVIIVGGGPSGLMMGNELAQFGIDALILEKRKKASLSRAGVIQPRVLEMFDSRGFVDTFINRAKELHPNPKSRFGVWAGLPGLDYQQLDSTFPHKLLLTQVETETILANRAMQVGAIFRRNIEVTDVREHDDYVEVDIIDQDDNYQTLTSQYVVGADGGHSTVRESLGIKWEGHEPTHSIVNLEVETPFPWSEHSAKFKDNKKGWCMAIPMNQHLTRFTVIDAQETTKSNQNEKVDVEKVKDSIQNIYGKKFDLDNVKSVLRFNDAMYMADKMQTKRVFLVGESVRVHYPAAGVGMNFCLQDAFNLGWKLAYTVKRGQSNGLLESYEQERKPAVIDHLEGVKKQTAIQLNFSWDMISFKRYFEKYLMPLKAVNLMLTKELAGLSYSYGDDGSLVGEPIRDAEIELDNGEKTSIYQALRDQQFVLLSLNNTSLPEVPDEIKPYVKTIDGKITSREELEENSTILIRPDGHIAWISKDEVSTSELQKELERWF